MTQKCPLLVDMCPAKIGLAVWPQYSIDLLRFVAFIGSIDLGSSRDNSLGLSSREERSIPNLSHLLDRQIWAPVAITLLGSPRERKRKGEGTFNLSDLFDR